MAIMRASLWSFALISLLGADCDTVSDEKVKGSDRWVSANSKPAPIACAHDDELSVFDNEIILKIDSIIAGASQCREVSEHGEKSSNQELGYCAVEEVVFETKQGHEWSKGQRILIIDHGMKSLSLTRYKKRVLDFVDFDDKGELVTDTKPLKIHQGRRLIFSQVLGEEHPYIPARKLHDLDRFKSIWTLFPEASRLAEHGNPIFEILAEHNPKAEFVVAQLPDLLSSPFEQYFCSPSEKSLSEIASLYSRTSDALLSLIKKHDVTFIQYAEDATFEAFKNQFSAKCRKIEADDKEKWIRKVQRKHFANFVKPLTSLKDVILVQAGASSPSYTLQANDRNYLMDCAALPNRLRVGALNMVAPELPVDGANRFDLLARSQFNAQGCVDLYINSGVNSGCSKSEWKKSWLAAPHAVKYSEDGILEQAQMGLTPSWASPVALSYLIYLKSRLPPQTTTEQLLAHANNFGKGKVKDPAFFAQFEKCRVKNDPSAAPPRNVSQWDRGL